MTVRIVVPDMLAAVAGGQREVLVDLGDGSAGNGGTGATTVTRLFDRLGTQLPLLERRLRDERAEVRRHVNVYVDGTDIRTADGGDTPVPDGALVQIIAAVSGG